MDLYWCARTRASRAVWMLEEARVEYQRVTVNIRDAEAQRPKAFLAASPMGKVPALVDGEAGVAESAAICLYVADRYAAGRLAPATDDPARGRFLYWLMFTPAVLEPAMAEKAGGWKPNPGASGWGSFDRMIATFEDGLGEAEWIMGDRFTAADVMLGSSAVFLRTFGMLPESPRLDAYADRCLARPGYQRALALES